MITVDSVFVARVEGERAGTTPRAAAAGSF